MITFALALLQGLSGPLFVPGRTADEVCSSLAPLEQNDLSRSSSRLEKGARLEVVVSYCTAKLVEFRYFEDENIRFDEIGRERLRYNFSQAVCSDDTLKLARLRDWTFRALVGTPSGMVATVHAECGFGIELTRYQKLEQGMPADVKAFLLRIAGCRMWTRPQATRDMQMQQAKAQTSLRCAQLKADGLALQKAHNSRGDVRRVLDETYRQRLGWAESDSL